MINKQLQWKFRLKKEVQYNDFAFWITLQYDDAHLTLNEDNLPCVNKLHCQDYFRQLRKSLKRKELPFKFKYFLVSEYGPENFRPHYHCLFLFKSQPRLEFNSLIKYREDLYQLLKKHWYHGYAYEKTFHSGVIGYLTSYVFKTGLDFVPPVKNFRLISNGIGVDYLKQINPVEAMDRLFKMNEGYLPRYYRDKIAPRVSLPSEYSSVEHFQRWLDRKSLSDNLLDLITNNNAKELNRYDSYEEFLSAQQQQLAFQREIALRNQKKRKNL